MTDNIDIILAAADLAVGQSTTVHCIFCRAKHEQKLSITRTAEGIVYRCWRVTCGKKGFIRSSGSPSVCGSGALRASSRDAALRGSGSWLPNAPKVFTPEYYHGTLIESTALRLWLYEQYEIPISKYSFKMADHARLFHPIQNRENVPVGDYLKRLPGAAQGGAKAQNFWHVDCPKVHYPTPQRGTAVVLAAEDILSASKLNELLPSVALLGTHMSMEMAMDIPADKLVLALDPNALGQSVKIKQKYNAMFKDGIDIVSLPKDPKDCSFVELRKYLCAYL